MTPLLTLRSLIRSAFGPSLCVLFILLGTDAAWGQSAPTVADAFRPENLFPSLPDMAADARVGAHAVAFMLYVYLLMRAFGQTASGETLLLSVMAVLVACGLGFYSPQLLDMFDEGIDNFDEEYGLPTDHNEVFERIQQFRDAYQPSASAVSTNAVTGADGGTLVGTPPAPGATEGSGGSTGSVNPLDIGAHADRAVQNVLGAINKLVKDFICLCIAGILWLLQGVYVAFIAFRYFLLQLGSILLPICIAGTLTESFRTQSYNFLFTLLGILCWPIGWALGHIGTLALTEWSLQYMNALLGTAAAFSAGGSVAAILAGSIAAATVSVVVLLIASFPLLVTIVWTFLVIISAPFGIQKFVTSGSNMFNDLAAGTAKGSLAAAIGMIGAAAGAAGAVGAAGGPGALLGSGGNAPGGAGGNGPLSGLQNLLGSGQGSGDGDGASGGDGDSANGQGGGRGSKRKLANPVSAVLAQIGRHLEGGGATADLAGGGEQEDSDSGSSSSSKPGQAGHGASDPAAKPGKKGLAAAGAAAGVAAIQGALAAAGAPSPKPQSGNEGNQIASAASGAHDPSTHDTDTNATSRRAQNSRVQLAGTAAAVGAISAAASGAAGSAANPGNPQLPSEGAPVRGSAPGVHTAAAHNADTTITASRGAAGGQRVRVVVSGSNPAAGAGSATDASSNPAPSTAPAPSAPAAVSGGGGSGASPVSAGLSSLAQGGTNFLRMGVTRWDGSANGFVSSASPGFPKHFGRPAPSSGGGGGGTSSAAAPAPAPASASSSSAPPPASAAPAPSSGGSVANFAQASAQVAQQGIPQWDGSASGFVSSTASRFPASVRSGGRGADQTPSISYRTSGGGGGGSAPGSSYVGGGGGGGGGSSGGASPSISVPNQGPTNGGDWRIEVEIETPSSQAARHVKMRRAPRA